MLKQQQSTTATKQTETLFGALHIIICIIEQILTCSIAPTQRKKQQQKHCQF